MSYDLTRTSPLIPPANTAATRADTPSPTSISSSTALLPEPQLLATPDTPALTPQIATEKAAAGTEKAKALGVNVEKRAFMKKLFDVAITGVGLTASIAVTVLSGGAATPVAVIACTMFGIAVADAVCAFRHYRDVKQGGQGLRHKADSLANGLFELAKKCHLTDEKADKLAKYGSATINIGLFVASVATSFGLGATGHLPSTLATSALTALTSPLVLAGQRVFDTWSNEQKNQEDKQAATLKKAPEAAPQILAKTQQPRQTLFNAPETNRPRAQTLPSPCIAYA